MGRTGDGDRVGEILLKISEKYILRDLRNSVYKSREIHFTERGVASLVGRTGGGDRVGGAFASGERRYDSNASTLPTLSQLTVAQLVERGTVIVILLLSLGRWFDSVP